MRGGDLWLDGQQQRETYAPLTRTATQSRRRRRASLPARRGHSSNPLRPQSSFGDARRASIRCSEPGHAEPRARTRFYRDVDRAWLHECIRRTAPDSNAYAMAGPEPIVLRTHLDAVVE